MSDFLQPYIYSLCHASGTNILASCLRARFVFYVTSGRQKANIAVRPSRPETKRSTDAHDEESTKALPSVLHCGVLAAVRISREAYLEHPLVETNKH